MEPGGHSSDELQHQTVRGCFNFDLHYQFDMARSATRLCLIFCFTYLCGGGAVYVCLWGRYVHVSVHTCLCICVRSVFLDCHTLFCWSSLSLNIGPVSSTTPEGLGSENLPASVSLALGLQTPILDRGVGDPNLEPCVSLTESSPQFSFVLLGRSTMTRS